MTTSIDDGLSPEILPPLITKSAASSEFTMLSELERPVSASGSSWMVG